MKKKNIIIIILILSISIGFAILSSTLSIDSNISIADASFDVHFDNVEKINSSIENDTYTYSENNTVLNFAVPLDKPGDYVDYKLYVVNSGTIDAALDSITVNIPQAAQDYITYSLTYYNGSNPTSGDLLKRGTNKPLKIHIEYKYDIDDFIDISTTTVTVALSYKQPQTVDNKYVWNFDYEGAEQTFTVPKTGTYKLEVWGAQGGNVNLSLNATGGYGGYSKGNITLTKNDIIYIYVGGKGSDCNSNQQVVSGGYNGGGHGGTIGGYWGGGGGATHIASENNILSRLKQYIGEYNNELTTCPSQEIYIVAGGGGGSGVWYTYATDGGHAGGSSGNKGDTSYRTNYWSINGGTQSSGGIGTGAYSSVRSGSFGQGGEITGENKGSGGGGGFFGGASGYDYGSSAAGGSGYIGNSSLTNKSMYCYNCTESSDTATKTVSTTNVSTTPTSNYAKMGNGYARITLIN